MGGPLGLLNMTQRILATPNHRLSSDVYDDSRRARLNEERIKCDTFPVATFPQYYAVKARAQLTVLVQCTLG